MPVNPLCDHKTHKKRNNVISILPADRQLGMVKQATPFRSTITVKSEGRVHPLGNVGICSGRYVLTWSQDLCCILRPGEQAEDDTLGQRPLRSMDERDDTPSCTSGAKGPAASWQRQSAIPRRRLSGSKNPGPPGGTTARSAPWRLNSVALAQSFKMSGKLCKPLPSSSGFGLFLLMAEPEQRSDCGNL